MKKVNLKVVLLAGLVAGATMVTSCNKEENNNEVSIVETKIFNALPHTSVIRYSWRHIIEYKDALGNIIKDEICLEERSEIICGILLEGHNYDTYIEGLGTLVETVLNPEGLITELRIKSNTMPAEDYDIFTGFAEEGTITFLEDAVIEDEKLLDKIGENFIPAGEYNIIFDGEDFVIIVSE